MWLAVLSIWIKFGLSWFVSFILKGEQSVLRKKLPINWLSQLLSYTSNKHFSYTTSCVLWRCVAWFWQTWKRAFLKSGRFTLDENTLRITSGYWRSKLRLMILWIIKVEKRSSPAVNSAQLWLPLSPVPHTHMHFEHFQGWQFHHVLGSLCQCPTSLSVKKLFLVSNLNLPCATSLLSGACREQ